MISFSWTYAHLFLTPFCRGSSFRFWMQVPIALVFLSVYCKICPWKLYAPYQDNQKVIFETVQWLSCPVDHYQYTLQCAKHALNFTHCKHLDAILVRFVLYVNTEGYSSPKSTYTVINGKILIRGKWCGEMSQQMIREGSDFVHRVMAGFISGYIRCTIDMKIWQYRSEQISWHYWSWKLSGNEVTCSPVISEFRFLHQAHVDYYSKKKYISYSHFSGPSLPYAIRLQLLVSQLA